MKFIIEKVLDKRQTVKAYSDRKISLKKWDLIKETIKWSPSSHGFEPYRILVVNKDNNLRKEIYDFMWKQGVVLSADKLLFFISLKHDAFINEDFIFNRALRRATEVNGKKDQEAKEVARKHADLVLNTHLNHQEKTDDWSMKQAYIALGMAMYTATILNIGSTPMEGFDRIKVDEIFKKHKLISPQETTAVVLALGYPKDKTSYGHRGTNMRVRVPMEEKFKEI